MSNLAGVVDTAMHESDLYEMLQDAGDAIFVVDQSGLIRFWNADAQRLLGWSAAAVLQQECAPVLDGCDSAGSPLCTQECALREITRRNTHVSAFDLDVKTASGTRKWVNVSIIVAQVNGERLLIHLLRDIHEQKQSEALTKEMTVLVGRLTSQRAKRLLEPIRAQAPAVDLTAQERKILHSLSRGVSTAAIGRELGVTPATVRNHVQHILQKLRVHTRLQAVLWAAQEGFSFGSEDLAPIPASVAMPGSAFWGSRQLQPARTRARRLLAPRCIPMR
jgi:PAS domain S-box-containing protein